MTTQRFTKACRNRELILCNKDLKLTLKTNKKGSGDDEQMFESV